MHIVYSNALHFAIQLLAFMQANSLQCTGAGAVMACSMQTETALTGEDTSCMHQRVVNLTKPHVLELQGTPDWCPDHQT